MNVHILLDASSSMDFGQKITKYEYGAKIGLGFSYLALKNSEKFEFSLFADNMEFIKAKKGNNTMIQILDFLNNKKVKGQSHFYESLMSFKKRLKSRSMIIMISDFLFDPKELELALRLFRRSELYILQVLDKEEMKFNMAGDFVLKDSEHGSVIKTFISNRLRSNYRDKMDRHIARLRDICTKVGATFETVTTDTDIFDAFYKVLR